jgi:hypothetical protein
MIYELVLEDEKDEITAISLVEDPAIEYDFVYFDKQEEVKFASVNDEKRLVLGPVLVPDKKIIRVDGEGKPYWVYLTADTIKKLSELYLQRKRNDSATLEHDEKISNVSIVESWITESRTKDKSAMYGMSVPVGTWMATMKINDDSIWEDYVKTGKVKGFSIEGMFGHKLVSNEMPKGAKFEKEYPNLNDDVLMKSISQYSKGEAKDLLDLIHSILEFEQPSITSSYPGEEASGSYVAPALLAEESEMNIFGYETSHFYICPGAIGTFNHLVNEMNITDDDLVDMIRAAAVIADSVFMIEARVIESGKAEERDLRRATTLVEMFKDVFQTINERTGMEHDISYMDGHIEVIKSYL